LFEILRERNALNMGFDLVAGCGGCLRMPFLVHELQELFQSSVMICSDDSIVKGGPYSTNIALKSKFEDFNSFAFGFATPNGLMEPILYQHHSSTLVGEAHVVSNLQTLTTVAIYEGEYRNTRHNNLISVIQIETSQILLPEIFKLQLKLNDEGTYNDTIDRLARVALNTSRIFST
jgi:molecular chaperone DnaK (HSP70)